MNLFKPEFWTFSELIWTSKNCWNPIWTPVEPYLNMIEPKQYLILNLNEPFEPSMSIFWTLSDLNFELFQSYFEPKKKLFKPKLNLNRTFSNLIEPYLNLNKTFSNLKPNFFKFYSKRLRKYEVKPHRRPTK